MTERNAETCIALVVRIVTILLGGEWVAVRAMSLLSQMKTACSGAEMVVVTVTLVIGCIEGLYI